MRNLHPDVIRSMAQIMTGHKGAEALNRLGKQLVVGAAMDKGFVDKQNENLKEVFARPYVCMGHFNVLTRFSFESDAGRFKWDFASGIVEGKSLQGHASSKGRQSIWVGPKAKKHWEEGNITGVVLIGFKDGDVGFYYIERDEFLDIDKDRLSVPTDSTDLETWKQNWEKLVFQPTFGSLMG